MRTKINRKLTITYVAAVLVCGLNALPAHAAIYTGLSVEYLHMKVEGTRLHPWNARFKLGAHLIPELAIEVQYASSIQDDSVNELKLANSENRAIYARYQSPDTYSGMVIYLLAGYAWTTIETSGTFAIPDQEFESFSWGIGLEERVKTLKKLNYTFQYSQYYNHDELMIEGYNVGLRFDF